MNSKLTVLKFPPNEAYPEPAKVCEEKDVLVQILANFDVHPDSLIRDFRRAFFKFFPKDYKECFEYSITKQPSRLRPYFAIINIKTGYKFHPFLETHLLSCCELLHTSQLSILYAEDN